MRTDLFSLNLLYLTYLFLLDYFTHLEILCLTPPISVNLGQMFVSDLIPP